MAWFRTTDFGEFREIRQEVLLGVMEVVEKAGAELRVPYPDRPPRQSLGGRGAASPVDFTVA